MEFNTLLKVGILATAVVGAGAAVHYYAVYLPARDAAIEATRREQAARAAELAAQDRTRTELLRLGEAQAKKQHITDRYNACLSRSDKLFAADWAEDCRQLAKKRQMDFDHCVNRGLSRSGCAAIWRVDNSESCSLPTARARSLKKKLEQAKDRCLRELQMGLE